MKYQALGLLSLVVLLPFVDVYPLVVVPLLILIVTASYLDYVNKARNHDRK